MDPCELHGQFKLSTFLDEIAGFFQLTYSFQPQRGPGVD
jgi:hypothetical protein